MAPVTLLTKMSSTISMLLARYPDYEAVSLFAAKYSVNENKSHIFILCVNCPLVAMDMKKTVEDILIQKKTSMGIVIVLKTKESYKRKSVTYASVLSHVTLLG